MASEAVKTPVASITTCEINPQIIKPAERNGRNWLIGDLKIFPKISPKQAIITPVEMVNQKGPNVDLLYLCLMSDLAKKRGRSSPLTP